ncbi:hypothetical protein H2203_002485 [Taxawa tesnikishii (nom. ined.)]|nr:hypothetical protein H2203_002485 [Dothideales sp. JES 119]
MAQWTNHVDDPSDQARTFTAESGRIEETVSARSREYAHTQQLPTTIEVVDKEVSGAVALLTWHAGDIAASDKETEVMNALTLCANEPDDPNSDSVQIDEMTSGVKFLQLNVGDRDDNDRAMFMTVAVMCSGMRNDAKPSVGNAQNNGTNRWHAVCGHLESAQRSTGRTFRIFDPRVQLHQGVNWNTLLHEDQPGAALRVDQVNGIAAPAELIRNCSGGHAVRMDRARITDMAGQQ